MKYNKVLTSGSHFSSLLLNSRVCGVSIIAGGLESWLAIVSQKSKGKPRGASQVFFFLVILFLSQ